MGATGLLDIDVLAAVTASYTDFKVSTICMASNNHY